MPQESNAPAALRWLLPGGLVLVFGTIAVLWLQTGVPTAGPTDGPAPREPLEPPILRPPTPRAPSAPRTEGADAPGPGAVAVPDGIIGDPTPGAPRAPGHVVTMRPVDRVLFALEGSTLDGTAEKVVYAAPPIRAVGFRDPGHETINRAHVDLDSDGRIDERWVFKGNGQVRRRVAPNDDEAYGDDQVWSTGRWVDLQ